MNVKRYMVVATLLALGPMLGACSGFAGTVADNWPHWAGGMPKDVPPRPGAPGYEEFIAHQHRQDAAAGNAADPGAAAPAGAPPPPRPTPPPPPPRPPPRPIPRSAGPLHSNSHRLTRGPITAAPHRAGC